MSGQSCQLSIFHLSGPRTFATVRVRSRWTISSKADLALLKMIDPPTTLPYLTLGEIDQVQVAEDIHVIGHPHGNLWSYSSGVVSQIRDGYTWTYSDKSTHEAKV